MLLFDGLDEMPAKQRTAVTVRIREFARQYPQVNWVVAVRDPALAIDVEARELWLLPIDPFELEAFLRGYLRHETADLVARELDKHPALRDICRIPLFATLLAGRVRRRGLDAIPAGPHVLLDEFVDYLLAPERSRVGVLLAHPPQRLRQAAGRLAHAMIERGQMLVSVHGARRSLAFDDADAVIADLVQAGLLTRSGGDVRFVLPTVQEFLAGEFICSLQSGSLAERLAAQISHPWGQTVQFALVLAADCSEALAAILGQPDDVFATRIRMVARVISWGAVVSSELRREVGECLGRFYVECSDSLWSLRDEVQHMLASSFAAPLPECVMAHLERLCFGYDVDILLCCLDDEAVLATLERSLHERSTFFFREQLLDRLAPIAAEAVQVFLTSVHGATDGERTGFLAEIGYGLAMLAKDPDVRATLVQEMESGSLPDETTSMLALELSEPDSAGQVLIRVLMGEGGGFYRASTRLWAWPRGLELGRRVIADPTTEAYARRSLLVGALDNWGEEGRAMVAAFTHDSDPVRRAEALGALAVRGDEEAFADLTQMVFSGEDLEIAKLWCYCVGLFDGKDTQTGLAAIVKCELDDAELRSVVNLLSFRLRHHIMEADLTGMASGLPRRAPHPAAIHGLQLIQRISPKDSREACALLADRVAYGDESCVYELQDILRELWRDYDRTSSTEYDWDFDQTMDRAIATLGARISQPLLLDIVCRGTWNIALAALRVLERSSPDLETLLLLHRKRMLDDGLLLESLQRTAFKQGVELTPELLRGS